MKHFLLILIFLIAAACLTAQEEFNGPFPGWVNIKTRFGARGNGKDDDTKAFQQAIDSLTQPVITYNTGRQAYYVIYVPEGIYNISSTLVLKGKIGVSIIGASPANTIIKWNGKDAGNMLLATGSSYFKISRFTWDANNHSGIEAIGIHWQAKETNAKSQSSAPVNIEISDIVFTGNCLYGIGGGTMAGAGMNQMDSEISIRRCVFKNCTAAGIFIVGYNALDYWVWDCQFIECKDGISCTSGNYHVYRSYFKGSKLADVHNSNCYYTSVRGSFSEGSYTFSHDEGGSSNPFKRIFQSNVVIAPSNIPVELYHLGKITLLDNQFDAATHPVVQTFIQTGSWAKGNYQIMSFNNTYKDKVPITFTSSPNKLFTTGDSYGIAPQKTDAVAFISNQEKTPVKTSRTIIAVPKGAGAKDIQALINQAMQLKGKRPVLYFPFGTYVLDEPLIINPGADMQLMGDGYLYASILTPAANFPKGKALLNIKGPSSVVIRDMQLNQFTNLASAIGGIAFTNIDQPGSQVFIDQLYSNSHRSLHADGLDYLYLQETNSFYSDGKLITGGPLVQKGGGTAALYCFGGQFAGLSTDKNALAVMKDCWWEGAMKKPLSFSGSGKITIDGAMVAPVKTDSTATLSIDKFSGKISLLNMYLQGGIEVNKNNPDLSLLLWNIHFYFALDPLKFNSKESNYKAAFIGLTTQCFIPGDKKCADISTVEDVYNGNIKTENFLPDMLSADRAALPRKYAAAKAGTSSILISRISVGDSNTAISFTK